MCVCSKHCWMGFGGLRSLTSFPGHVEEEHSLGMRLKKHRCACMDSSSTLYVCIIYPFLPASLLPSFLLLPFFPPFSSLSSSIAPSLPSSPFSSLFLLPFLPPSLPFSLPLYLLSLSLLLTLSTFSKSQSWS